MKIVKMKIKRTETGGMTSYTYPTPYYNKDKVKFLQYESGEFAQGNNFQWILIGVKNQDLAGFLEANGVNRDGFIFEAIEVSRAEAIADGDKWVKTREKITDKDKVLSILAKVARNEELTQDEKDSIDPEKEARGINKTPTFTESLDKALNNSKFD